MDIPVHRGGGSIRVARIWHITSNSLTSGQTKRKIYLLYLPFPIYCIAVSIADVAPLTVYELMAKDYRRLMERSNHG